MLISWCWWSLAAGAGLVAIPLVIVFVWRAVKFINSINVWRR